MFTIFISDMNTLYKEDLIEHCTTPPEYMKIPKRNSKKNVDSSSSSSNVNSNNGDNNNSSSSSSSSNNNNKNNNNGGSSGNSINNNIGYHNLWRPLIILMPLRLGLDRINQIYYPSLFKILEFPQSVGIVGGRPKHSVYFIGYQGSYLICIGLLSIFQVPIFHDFIFKKDANLIYLDPHVVQAAQTLEEEPENTDGTAAPTGYFAKFLSPPLSSSPTTNAPLSAPPPTAIPKFKFKPKFNYRSYHCKTPRRMPLASVDPSMCFGFYCKDKEDFEDFCERVKQASLLAGRFNLPLVSNFFFFFFFGFQTVLDGSGLPAHRSRSR